MPSTINLRHDQRVQDAGNSQNPGIIVYAAGWVKPFLDGLGKLLRGRQFRVIDKNSAVLENFQLTGQFSLVQLQKISRSEPYNTSGVIRFSDYDIQDTKIILALRDLVRQTIIVGKDQTTHFGGYPKGSPRNQQCAKVYIVDLSGLQFQTPYNTGRLVLVPQNQKDSPVGLLDDYIFNTVVGQPRIKSFQEASMDRTGRFELTCGNVYFDILAYRKFVSQDFVLCVLALNQSANRDREPLVHFKFLKYGTGFFGGRYQNVLERHILSGVVDGLEVLYSRYFPNSNSAIMHFEFPFFQPDQVNLDRLNTLKSTHGIDFSFTKDDALQVGPHVKGIVATTNCADPHAVTGNEMRFGSVDAAIAENIRSKGNTFSCCLNRAMGQRFIGL